MLGILPMVDDREIAASIADQKSGLSEAYRSLRTSLQFSGAEGAPRSLLVTSSEPSEGKSTTSFKLGQDFAALGAGFFWSTAILESRTSIDCSASTTRWA